MGDKILDTILEVIREAKFTINLNFFTIEAHVVWILIFIVAIVFAFQL